jgi:coproporphyrinogen III oxidase
MLLVNKEIIATSFKNLQDNICKDIEDLDGKARFESDVWKREQGGGGRTNTIANGALLQKGGVAFSEVFGTISDEMKRQLNFNQGENFYATGVSIVLHPENPHIPIIHMNVRYFQIDENTYWFGGGIDLTPHYIVSSQARLFHEQLKHVCDQFSIDFYPKFKEQADDYFYIPHRNETRGVGGIFFDHLNETNTSLTKEQLHKFVLAVGNEFVECYRLQAELGREKSYTIEEIKWRNIRRGRYVEFNLVNDRGTKFGLFSGGRTESILMSLPAEANWEYNLQLESASKEKETLNLLKKNIDWLNFKATKF